MKNFLKKYAKVLVPLIVAIAGFAGYSVNPEAVNTIVDNIIQSVE